MNTIVYTLCLAAVLTGCVSAPAVETSEASQSMVIETTAITTEILEPTETTIDIQALHESMSEALVGRIYEDLMGEPMPSEEWEELIVSLSNDEITANDVVDTFIQSDIMSDESMTDEDFIRGCYRAFRGGEPDGNELRFCEGLLADGVTREDAALILMQSEQFGEECSEYGFLVEYTPMASEYFEDTYGYINSIPSTGNVSSIGGFVPDSNSLSLLYDAMEELHYEFSFILLDVNTGRGLSYNQDAIYYTASSIKGPFAASFCCQAPDIAAGWENTIISMLETSDNDAYAALNDTYHRVYIQQWCEQIGLDTVPFGWKYPHIGVRQMAALWMRSYEFFEEGEWGATVGTWFENPTYSVIRSELGELYTTRSKAGWLVDEEPDHTTSIDAGIVYADNGPYVVVIMSRVPSSLEYLRPLLQALEAAHQCM